jgi:hypothetical protein
MALEGPFSSSCGPTMRARRAKPLFGPGASRPDPRAGSTAIADLPQPEMVPASRHDRRNACPRCGHVAYRDKQSRRTLHALGTLELWCPRDLVGTYAPHDCPKGRTYFHVDLSDLAPAGSHYTQRAMALAVRRVVEDGLPSRPARGHLGRDPRVFVPCATLQHWGEAGGKQGAGAPGHRLPGTGRWRIVRALWPPLQCMRGPAACLLRSLSAATSVSATTSWLHAPDHADIRACLGRCKTAWAARGLTLAGVTPDGAARSPAPLVEVCGDVPQPSGPLPVVAAGGNAVLGAVASARQGLAAQHPTRRQGRPRTAAAQQAARTTKRLAAPRAGWGTPRYLCVQRHLPTTDRQSLGRLTRELPQWRTLRTRMAQGYALCDRRGRPQTALATLATRRRRRRRFTQGGETLKKLWSPTLAKALPVLDDTLLPSTSQAVERGNRRDRKRQQQVYRVRTQAPISARLALDMWREAQGAGRHQTLHTVHEARAA